MTLGTQRQSLWDRVYNRLSFYPVPGVIRNPRLASAPMNRICEAAKADRREAQRRAAAQLAPFALSKPLFRAPPLPLVTQIGGKTFQLILESVEPGRSSYRAVAWPDYTTDHAVAWPDYVTEAIATPYPGGNDDDEQETDD